ncbi:hypothetical protein O6H91_02G114000 [Diphasiastrum complanatum]|uniref:Uncharacterized protein n=1 Tax=Diphasiastrum complanatum TaxID=34168 RepID=A0ACC2EJN5_DIPCM|nr:hypothetical protein O6H91_02G114000 [Diphasiastrum complanatum]
MALEPVTYHGKWPFDRILGLQEPASVVFSLLNLLEHILGVVSFLVVVYHKLPIGFWIHGRRICAVPIR